MNVWGSAWGAAWGSAWGGFAKKTGAGGGNGKRRRKLYVVEVDGVDRWFDDPAQALAALESIQKPEPKTTRKQRKDAAKALKASPQVVEIPLAPLEEWAGLAGLMAEYQAAYNSQHYAALLRMFVAMRDEDDIEALLLAL